MSGVSVDSGGRYWAFISYSHKDAVFGRRLHRRLEGYSLPRRLARADRTLPRRLTPIFRDREELPAAQDLSAEVRAALAQSRALIVVCSPAAAVSPWVAREIELFRALHPGRPILAAIREGDPKDAFPPLLRLKSQSGEDIEPLAADFRKEHDGPELGLLKLVAGLLGLGLDELVRRDGQRQLRRVTAITVAAIFAMLVMTVLTAIALTERSEAERQRAQAENMVKFMSTDLREKLQGFGRLDLMRTVNEFGLSYCRGEAGQLSSQGVMQCALLYQARGDDYETEGNAKAARAYFLQAWNLTSDLLAKASGDPERIFSHAQSEYWLGYDDYVHDRLDRAAGHFRRYLQAAERLAAGFPRSARFVRELGYAYGNLCSVALHPAKRDPAGALRLCQRALAYMQAAARLDPALNGIRADLANRESWLGSAYRASHDDASAMVHWLSQESILTGLMTAEPLNAPNREAWIRLQRLLARADAGAGNIGRARHRLEDALAELDGLIRLEPHNRDWLKLREKLQAELSSLKDNPRGDTK